jgi:hypothetical protein
VRQHLTCGNDSNSINLNLRNVNKQSRDDFNYFSHTNNNITTTHNKDAPAPRNGIGDSGCTGHYIALRDREVLTDIIPCTATNSIVVTMPNGTVSISTHTGNLKNSKLPPAARRAYLFADQTAQPLISIGQLCDNGMACTLDAKRLSVMDGNDEVMFGTRNPRTGLWEIDLVATDEAVRFAANNVIRNTSDHELMAFYHQVFYSPAWSTMQRAADLGLLDGLPGFTAKKLRKNQINTPATAKGHMAGKRQGQNSTHRTETRQQRAQRDAATRDSENREKDTFPDSIEAQREVLFVHLGALHNNTEHIDATGKFMLQSHSKGWYLLIIYSEDANYIHIEILKSRTAEAYRSAMQKAHEFFATRGCTPHYTWLDNETSALVGKHFDEWKITPNYVPRGGHRANRAERAVRTTKEHLIAGLQTVADDFPPEFWDELVPQGEVTLNMMRLSRMTPNISAFQQVCGHYDHDSHPMSLPGVRVEIYISPGDRESFQAHTDKGHYLGAAYDHYRSYRVVADSTRAIRISDQLAWFPKDVTMPGASPTERLISALDDMKTALTEFLAKSNISMENQPPEVQTQTQILQRVANAFLPAAVDTGRATAPAVPAAIAYDAPPGLPAPVQRYQLPITRSHTAAVGQLVAPVAVSTIVRQATEGGVMPRAAPTLVISPPLPAVQPATEGGRIPPPTNVLKAAVPLDALDDDESEGQNVQPTTRPHPNSDTGAFNRVTAERKKAARQRSNDSRKAKLQAKKAAALQVENKITHSAFHAAQQTCDQMKTPDQLNFWFCHYAAQAGRTTFSQNSWGEHFANGVSDYSIDNNTGTYTKDDNTKNYAYGATDDITGKPLRLKALRNGPDSAVWIQASREEFIRLMRETHTMRPCHPQTKPSGQTASYYNQVCSIKNKEGIRLARVRGTFGGEVIA